jgi:DNA-binding GntR family transcriptional regulator
MADHSQSTMIYDRLRLAILQLDLSPGQRLTERGLEAEFAASRTPVRAALLRLDTEGLVQREGRGWIVSPIDLDELDSLAEYRAAIETATVRLACERAGDDDLDGALELLESFHATADDDGAPHPATDFHIELAILAGNPFLVAALRDVMTRLSRTRWLELRNEETRELAWREHRDVLTHIVARDADAAAASVVAHIRKTSERLRASLEHDRKRFSASGLSIVGSASGPQRSAHDSA